MNGYLPARTRQLKRDFAAKSPRSAGHKHYFFFFGNAGHLVEDLEFGWMRGRKSR